MRVLWFSGNPSMYANSNKYNGGGWVASLQKELLDSHSDEIELAIAFPWGTNLKDHGENCIYYGVQSIKRVFVNYQTKESKCLKRVKEIVDDYRPDVIQVFGTEEIFGLVSFITDIPVIIHIQGILNAYKETWLPYSLSWEKYLFDNPMQIVTVHALKVFMRRELRILRNAKYIFGRTEWDKGIASLLAPSAQYFYCSEMLRPAIYSSNKGWTRGNRNKKKIISIISEAVYKGGDIILRSARLLKEQTDMEFDWNVYGVSSLSYASKYTGINPSDVNVNVCGVVNAEQLVEIIRDGDVYVHPSYIENSPNTVCEAQLLGIPVIATNVGGVSSLIHNNKDGIIVPVNDIFTTVYNIKRVIDDRELSKNLSDNGRDTALVRHKPSQIIKDLVTTYKLITNK